tara:strand:- start:130 stop:357 length:228 start_codon:yes stop_codon:yes gene_type:complete
MLFAGIMCMENPMWEWLIAPIGLVGLGMAVGWFVSQYVERTAYDDYHNWQLEQIKQDEDYRAWQSGEGLPNDRPN